jgi:tetratricopeptide (TPR) repeat protein
MGRSAGAVLAPGRVGRCSRLAVGVAAVSLGIGLLVGAPAAGAQGIWDDPAFALYRQAVDAMERKDFPRAGDLAAQAIAQYAGNVPAHYLRGQAAVAQSRWDEAAAAFAKTVELYPGSFAAQRDLALSCERLDRYDEAVRAYESALALRDQDDLRARLAFALFRAGQQPRAMSELKTLAQRDTPMPEVWTTLGRLAYETGDLATSEKAYARAATLKDDGSVWFNLGVVRVALKDFPGALQSFERAAKHEDVRKQAEAEASRLRETMRRERAPSSNVPNPPTRIDQPPRR